MTKRKGEKKEIILQSAKEVFAEVGYHNASMSRIAKNAGIGDGTVYIYFENKEDILITLYKNNIFNDYLTSLENRISCYEDAKIQLFELVNSHFKYFNHDRLLSRIIQIELRQTTPLISNAIKPGIIRQFKIIESIVRKGQEQGEFRKDISDRDARKLIFGTLDEVVTCWVLSTKEYSLIKMVEPTYKMFLQALINIPNSYLFSLMNSSNCVSNE